MHRGGCIKGASSSVVSTVRPAQAATDNLLNKAFSTVANPRPTEAFISDASFLLLCKPHQTRASNNIHSMIHEIEIIHQIIC